MLISQSKYYIKPITKSLLLLQSNLNKPLIKLKPVSLLARAAINITLSTGLVMFAGIFTNMAMAQIDDGMPSTAKGEWPSYTGDIIGSRYSPLDQIDASNFNELELAWSFKTDNLGSRPEYKLEGTPLMVNGVLYTTAGTRRTAIALDAATGELKWLHSMQEGFRAGMGPRQLSGRGLSYWTDGKGDERIFYVTTGYKLVSLDADSGIPINSFGPNGDGIVDLKIGVVYGNEKQIDLVTGEIGIHSAPTVVGDMIIIGSAMKEGMTVETHDNTKGLVRAFNVRTGKMVWQFNTIPRPGEYGNDTWLNGSWENNGNTGVWTQITVDVENELVYLPVESPTSDFYGGTRPGNNLFGESLVAVDLNTGKYKWHFQFVHHAIWDHDMSSAPLIIDFMKDGENIHAVAVPSKQAFLYVFDRITGEPIWPIPEVPVPVGNVPGEWYSPTQPRPPAELMYGRPELNVPDDLIDFTPEMRAVAIKKLERWVWEEGTLYNPAIVGDVKGKLGALNLGYAVGGTNWPGGAFDPTTGIVYVQSNTSNINGLSVAPPPEGFSDLPYQLGRLGQNFRIAYAAGTGDNPGAPKREVIRPTTPRVEIPSLNVEGLPLLKPPYGVLNAIDLNKGSVKWQVPHGETPDNVRHHPKLKDIEIPRTGQGASVGMIVTKTLVILGDPRVTNPGDRERGAMLRAYDKETGQEVGTVWMPAQQSGSPMTYALNGKQYIVVAVSGGAYSGEYRAYAIPDD